MTMTRRIDKNQGGLIDRRMPDDREIVGGFIVLRDDEGHFSVYVTDGHHEAKDDVRQPEPESAFELAAHIAQAYELANL